ncbi:helix-turn-helix domain-containing protein [Dongshaea marina]|uniref:helix-turn-helix domain-containing protein n=1 Tax=Dongshaea marina TaxID=2047966 RepID=UPI00131F05CE|nr:helix-turn-helix transcriptional regulator [Dongshaea marina]
MLYTDAIKQQMRQKNLTLEQLAKDSHCDPARLRGYLTHNRLPPYPELQRIMSVLEHSS